MSMRHERNTASNRERLPRATAATSPDRAQRLRRRAGFTFIELMIAGTMAVLILGGVAAISFAVTEGWRATERAQLLQKTSSQTSVQLYKMLRSANFVGLATADDQQATALTVVSASSGAGAALMFWTEDPAGADAKIEAGEVCVIEHDRSDNTLKLYQIPASSVDCTKRLYTSDISSSSGIAAFKALSGVTCRVIASGVTAAAFSASYTNDIATRQSVDYRLTFEQGGQTRQECGTSVLRCPIQPDDT